MRFKSALEQYNSGSLRADEPVVINKDRVPVKSDIFKCVFHITASDLSVNSSIDVIGERKSLVSNQLLQELAHWKSKIISYLKADSVEFVDKIAISVSSTEIRGEAMTVIKSIGGLAIDPALEYVEIAHAPNFNLAWHKGE